ncbi:type I inositol polyphosphate 5-phosphatase 4-like [Cynara cardunculus var. scolymus]|uniref:type I inositol polyphosphate 5-phosphatase 4-like n=1 Tax=Cynara cardunculus var. scolymus TaxID=59895 RepID=UPI000D62EFE0|nr:type I inositol polyphosphate 5-phosphatase 4-like [Cynara cardunculus var. scolymus]XP_024981392.1 type I inositol polyphosphate 5-phosphatase 4-like [Cynara cardunculus var. scolymus]
MDNDYRPKIQRFGRWFTNKHKFRSHSSLSTHLSDGSGDEYEEEDLSISSEMDPCILTNELRIFVATWNVAGRSPVGSLAMDLDEWLNVKESADIYVLGFQEIVPLKAKNVIGGEDLTEATNWNLLIGQILNGCPWMLNPVTSEDYNYLNVSKRETRAGTSSQEEELNGCSRYRLMASKKMVGVFISVWMNTRLFKRYCISKVKVCAVACGVMGYLGNKGSVSVSMSIEGTSFCFIVAHLASGEKKGDEGRRNHQVSEIFKRTTFTQHLPDDYSPRPLTILGHDQIFWFGDLNYRLYLQDDIARELIKKQDWRALQEFDQLRQELGDGGVFQGWREGNIEFAPTYKYSTFNSNRYSGTLPSRAGEKQRTPAWCDRILWYGKGVKQHSYFRSESKFSDHRPVSALFSTQIEVVKSDDTSVVSLQPDVPTTVYSKHTERGNAEASSTLLSLITKELKASPTNKKKS